MVRNDIKHDPDVPCVASVDQALEVIVCAEVLIDFLPVKSSIAVVISLGIVRDRRYPDSVEAHTLDVVQVVLDSFECAAAVFGQIIALVS